MELKLENLDMSKCLINPTNTDLINVTKHIPEFNVKLTYRMSLKMVIRYIIIMYDEKSALWREVRSLPLRKAVAMELAGEKPNKQGKFERPIEIIFEGGNQDVNAMIVKYISMQNSPFWTQRCAYETIYYMELAKVQNGAYGNTLNTIKSLDQLSKAITELTDVILGGSGEAPSILEAIYKEATKHLDVSAEKVSDYISNSGDVPPEWNPYNKWKETTGALEEEYKVDKIRFVGDK
jgi:hypothetical protein